MFVNGLACYEYLLNLNCTDCSKVFVITDLSMPHKNGIELAKDLRTNIVKTARIILVSAEEYQDTESLFDSIY